MSEERLQKILARAGVASRRKAEELITAGRVRVDGRVVTELGSVADPRRARVEVDGRRIVAEPIAYVVLHKPREVVSTLHDPEGRRTVADLVRGVGVRVHPIGRLDYFTSGALLLTNDGELSSVLMHARHKVPKEYLLKVRGHVTDAELEKLRASIDVQGRRTAPAEVHLVRIEEKRSVIRIVLREGRNRQVRRLAEHAGLVVLRLHRLSQAGISVEDLRQGQWRHLSMEELVELKRQYGVPRRVRSASPEALGERARRSTKRPLRARTPDKRPRKSPPRDKSRA